MYKVLCFKRNISTNRNPKNNFKRIQDMLLKIFKLASCNVIFFMLKNR